MTNIVSAISRFLTPEVVSQMASACGLDGAMAQKAVNAAVPSILSGLVGVAEKPGGARLLAKAVSEQPTDLLGNLVSSLNGSAQMAEKGTGLLSSLLSGGGLGILTSTVSKFLGIGEGSTRTLMGLLGPVILGVLGREQHTGQWPHPHAYRAEGYDRRRLAARLGQAARRQRAARQHRIGRVAGKAHRPDSLGVPSIRRHRRSAGG